MLLRSKGKEVISGRSGQVRCTRIALSGNVAGVQVTAPLSLGGSTRITMRGISSVTGETRTL